jgi:hypothetical protein
VSYLDALLRHDTIADLTATGLDLFVCYPDDCSIYSQRQGISERPLAQVQNSASRFADFE